MGKRSARCNHIVNGPPINLLGRVERRQAVPASEARCAGHPSVWPLARRRLAPKASLGGSVGAKRRDRTTDTAIFRLIFFNKVKPSENGTCLIGQRGSTSYIGFV